MVILTNILTKSWPSIIIMKWVVLQIQLPILYIYLLSWLLSKNLKIKMYRTIILPVVYMGVKLGRWRWGRNVGLRVFENKVLRRIFGPRRDEVTGEWRKLRNEELNDLYSLPSFARVIKSRRMRWAGHVVYGWEVRCIQGSGGETWGKEAILETQA